MLSTNRTPTGGFLEEAGGRLWGHGKDARPVGSETRNAPGVGRPLQTGLAFMGALIASLCPADSHGEMVFGNYAGYRFWQMSPDQIDWSGINCVLHFAALPQSDGTINLSAFQLFPARIEQMVTLARQNDACITLAVGGANTKRQFAEATADRSRRQTLIENIVNTIVRYGYDGVDIDWEPLQDRDQAIFTAFIRELRTALPRDAMLTVAAPFVFGTHENREAAKIIASVVDDLDYVHLMAYALAGPWGGWVTWHNSALHNGGEKPPKSTKELPSAEAMVEQYAAAGVPHHKMTLGLAFFGKIWLGGEGTPTGGVTAPRQSWTSKPKLSREYQYHEIIARGDFRGNDHWDDVAKNPYVSVDRPGAAEDLFLPYESPRSIKEKVRFAAERGLAGVVIWELRGDFLPDGSHPLLTALKQEYLAHYALLPGDVPFGPSASRSAPAGAQAPGTTAGETPRKPQK